MEEFSCSCKLALFCRFKLTVSVLQFLTKCGRLRLTKTVLATFVILSPHSRFISSSYLFISLASTLCGPFFTSNAHFADTSLFYNLFQNQNAVDHGTWYVSMGK